MKKITLFSLFVLLVQYSFGQTDSLQLLETEECFELDKKNHDYLIKVGGHYFSDRDHISICASNLPDTISIVRQDSSVVSGINWDWSGCDCVAYIDHQAIITSASVANVNNAKLQVRFDESDPSLPQGIKLKTKLSVLNSVKLDDYKTTKVSHFAYDENKIMEYPTSNLKYPWKFTLKDSADYLTPLLPFNASAKRKKHFNTLLNWRTTPDSSVYVFGHDKEILNVLYNGSMDYDSILVKACADTVFQLSSKHLDTIHIIVYTVCESDDDFENYCVDKDMDGIPYEQGDYDGSLKGDCVTPIDSLFECIDRGLDGSLDLFLDVNENNTSSNFWITKENDPNRPVDSISRNLFSPDKDEQRIYASKDSSGYFCNNRVQVKPTMWNQDTNGDGKLDAFISDCSTMSTSKFNNLSIHLNAIYEQVGIYINVINGGQQNLNANLTLLGIKWVDTEQSYLHKLHYGFALDSMNNPIDNDTTVVWALNSISVNGRATLDFDNNPRNSFIYNMVDATPRTISHELGHAKFKLYHPDGSLKNVMGNPCPVGSETGYKEDDLSAPFGGDLYNFMNSGCLYSDDVNLTKTTHNLQEIKIRQYQWRKIIKQLE